MYTIGIDQSYTSTGVVIAKGDDVIHYEIINTAKDHNDAMTNFRRAEEISDKIYDLCVKYDVTGIHIEGLGFGATGDATRNLAGLQYLIITKILKLGIDPLIIAPTSLKKFATGSGKAKKEEVFDCIEAKNPSFYISLQDVKKTKGRYDLADAFWLAMFDSAKD